MDLTGIALFLALTYGVGYALAFGGFYSGLLNVQSGSILHTMLMVLLFNLPAIFAFIAGQLRGGPSLARVFPVSKVTILRVAVLMVFVFGAFNLVATAFRLTSLDWRLGTLINILQQGHDPLTPQTLATLPALFIIVGTLATLLLGATLVAAGVIGHVYAWHVYLQDRLAPLGKLRATLIGGVLWALWFAPFVLANVQATGQFELPGAFAKFFFLPIGGILVAISLTALVRQAYERSGGLALPCVVLGSYVAHTQLGIWGYLFQLQTPPWTGNLGVIAAAFWLLLAVFPGVLLGTKNEMDPAPQAES